MLVTEQWKYPFTAFVWTQNLCKSHGTIPQNIFFWVHAGLKYLKCE